VSRRPFVLASASTARLRLLREAGFDPIVVVSGVDEETITAEDPHDLVRLLAEAKTAAVVGRADVPPDALVLGCDSMLLFDGRMLGKAASADDALDRWRRMRGREGTLLTGHCLHDTRRGAGAGGVAATTVRFGSPTDDEIAAYIASGEPLQVAGSFTIDGRGGSFVERIDGDHGNVVGVSLPLVRTLLQQHSVGVHELWD
jgi:septum formation protein